MADMCMADSGGGFVWRILVVKFVWADLTPCYGRPAGGIAMHWPVAQGVRALELALEPARSPPNLTS